MVGRAGTDAYDHLGEGPLRRGRGGHDRVVHHRLSDDERALHQTEREDAAPDRPCAEAAGGGEREEHGGEDSVVEAEDEARAEALRQPAARDLAAAHRPHVHRGVRASSGGHEA